MQYYVIYLQTNKITKYCNLYIHTPIDEFCCQHLLRFLLYTFHPLRGGVNFQLKRCLAFVFYQKKPIHCGSGPVYLLDLKEAD